MGKGKSPGKWIKNLLLGKKSSSKSNSSKKNDIFKLSSNKDVLGFCEVSVSDPTVDSLLISPPISGANATKGVHVHSENEVVSRSSHDRDILPNGDEEAREPAIANFGPQDDPEKLRLTEAAIKVQAACRGYQARQEFQTLKGITQLQALIRGHLVRRQAVSALYCVKGIVKFQALSRGYNVRRSDIGLEVLKIRKDTQCSNSVGVVTSTQAEKLSENVFVHKLLASSSYALPLSLNGDIGEPYLGWKWLDRWTSSHFWAPLPKLKKQLDSVSYEKNSSCQTVERGQVKRNTRKSPTVKVDDGSISGSNKHKPRPKKESNHLLLSAQEHPQKEIEKSGLKKTHMQNVSDRSEIVNEKRKHTRKSADHTVTDVSEQGPNSTSEKMKDSTVPKSKESHPEKGLGMQTNGENNNNNKPDNNPTAVLQTSVKKTKDSTVPRSKESYPEKGLGTQAKEESNNNPHSDPTAVLQTSVKKMKDSTVPKSKESYPEKGLGMQAKEESNNNPHSDPTAVLQTSVKKVKDLTVRKPKDSYPEKGLGTQAKVENNNMPHDDPTAVLETSVKNGEDEKVGVSEVLSGGDKIISNNCQRRASLPANFSDQDNELRNTLSPRLPSYMAPTESAKARLRGQGSPRFTTDFVDKNSITRRHSLSSSLNSRSGSFSPRAEKLIAMSSRGVTRTDRSLSSSRDGTEKLTQPQWRR